MMPAGQPLLFTTQDSRFKDPPGPVTAGTRVTYRLPVSRLLSSWQVTLQVLFDKDTEYVDYPMEPLPSLPKDNFSKDYVVFVATVPYGDTGLYWFRFRLTKDGREMYFGKDAATGEPSQQDNSPAAWQQTVYLRKYHAPTWLYGGVMYHIFVDRFYRGRKSPGLNEPSLAIKDKVLHQDWGGMPEYRPDENGEVKNNDFFGGNLAGIKEKLPYLADLGITCLYLSPIFTAYSNHKYDTADYMHVDPMFGSNDDFETLCKEAKKLGMEIICDGVFSHTGADSIYFDKYGNYGGNGAWENPNSPYRHWYYFTDKETENIPYETWWGIKTLPRLNKEEPSYIDYITGPQGVIAKWIKAGAAGWRLDVVDELPQSFLEKLVESAKKQRKDALILGEVWEEASTKSAYDERKNYFEGNKLDAVTNYPLRDAIIRFSRYGDADGLRQTMELLVNNYPPEVLHCLMNHLGNHDTNRILTALGGKELPPEASREEKAHTHMTAEEKAIALRRLQTAVVLQMTLPGIPCIYYGDEAETEGYNDPFNRTCFPWGKENKQLQQWYKKLITIRHSSTVFARGSYRLLIAKNSLFAFSRSASDQEFITVCNQSPTMRHLPYHGCFTDLLSGRIEKNTITVYPYENLLLQRNQ